MVKTVLCILAAVCFGLEAFKVPAVINWTPAGFCLLVVALTLV